MLKVDFAKLDDVLDIDADKIKGAVAFTEGFETMRAEGRKKLWALVLKGASAAIVALGGWAMTGFHLPGMK